MDYLRIAAREFGVQFCDVCLRTMSPEMGRKAIPGAFYKSIIVPEDKVEVFYVEPVAWDGFCEALKKRYLFSEANFRKLDHGFAEATEAALAIIDKIKGTNLKKVADAELSKLFAEYRESDLGYITYDWILWQLNNLSSEETKRVVERLGKNAGLPQQKVLSICAVMLSPEKESSMRKLKAMASKWGGMAAEGRTELYERYKSIPCPDYHYPPFTFKQFAEYMNGLKDERKEHEISYSEGLRLLKPSKGERQLFDRTRRLAYLKDFKDDAKRMRFCDAQLLYGEIGRRAGMDLMAASYMTPEEITQFLDGGNKPDKKLIKQRMDSGFAIYYDDSNVVRCVSGKKVAPILERIGYHKQASGATSKITGMTASQGYVKGRAIVVKSMSDLYKVKKGDIMVAIATVPDFVPAMERAAGIIAEEGGITSHAAIVSRELKLPCIVGAANVTRIVKDGDTLELDADNGVVKII